MDLHLEGRVAIVTGASRGLGRAVVEAFVAEGMRVVAVARTVDELRRLANACPNGTIDVVPCDMLELVEVAALADRAIETFGRLDVVVNNAGIAPAAHFVEEPIDAWIPVFTINVFAPAALAKAAGPHFFAQGSGKIINVASTSGLRGKPTLAAYSASKGAMLRFTEALAGEWARHGVQVNAIAPGAFATTAQQAVLDDSAILERRLRKIPAGRMGAPDEIGALACYLASTRSDFVTGSVYVIDGGELAKL